MSDTVFLTDIKVLRDRVRQHIEYGAGATGYNAGPAKIVKILNDVLAMEIAFELKYEGHHLMAPRIDDYVVAGDFLEYTDEEPTHVDQIADRILQLGGVPDLFPERLLHRSHAEYVKGKSLSDLLEENLMAERIANDCYIEIINFLDNNDPITRRMLEEIQTVEKEYAYDLAGMIKKLAAKKCGKWSWPASFNTAGRLVDVRR